MAIILNYRLKENDFTLIGGSLQCQSMNQCKLHSDFRLQVISWRSRLRQLSSDEAKNIRLMGVFASYIDLL